MNKFKELFEGKISFSGLQDKIKNKEDFSQLTNIEAYVHPKLGYIIRYKGNIIYSDKEGLRVKKFNYSKELQRLVELIRFTLNVKIEFKDLDILDKKWLDIWSKAY